MCSSPCASPTSTPPLAFYSQSLRRGARQAAPRLRELRHHRAPLKLVLLEGATGEATRMDHLGVEVTSTDEVVGRHHPARRGRAWPPASRTTPRVATPCRTRSGSTGPGGEPWEVYTVTGDAHPELEGKTEIELSAVAGDGTCCRDGSDADARLSRRLLLREYDRARLPRRNLRGRPHRRVPPRGRHRPAGRGCPALRSDAPVAVAGHPLRRLGGAPLRRSGPGSLLPSLSSSAHGQVGHEKPLPGRDPHARAPGQVVQGRDVARGVVGTRIEER